MRGAPRRTRGRLLPLAAGAVVALGVAAAGPADAQEPDADPDAVAPLEEPPMASAPRQFRLAVTGGALGWDEEPQRAALDAGGLFGLDVERRVGPFVAFRVGGAYGRTTAADDTAAVDVNQFLVDVAVSPRLGLPSLRRAGVVPFGSIGLATVVHDPEADGLVTKSQSAAAFGAGVDADLPGVLGLRAEWRRYLVDSEDLFDPTSRTGKGRVADRFYGALYLEL